MSSAKDTDALAVTSQQQQPATWMKQFRIDYSCDMPKLKKARTEVMKVRVSITCIADILAAVMFVTPQ